MSSFYRQGDQGIEQLNNLPKVTQLVSGRARFERRQAGSSIHALNHHATLPCLSMFVELSDWKVRLVSILIKKYRIIKHLWQNVNDWYLSE